MDARKLALLCRELADNKKAENIVILDVHELSSVTDYFVIASCTSEPHLRAIVDEINSKLAEEHQLKTVPIGTTVVAANPVRPGIESASTPGSDAVSGEVPFAGFLAQVLRRSVRGTP